MIISSLKQLFRQPGKALLFFLLMAASTALVVTGTVMTMENAQRIQTVEDSYTTIGTVEQPPLTSETMFRTSLCEGTYSFSRPDYGDVLLPEDLIFPGADYVREPEYRPYFLFVREDMDHANGTCLRRHILEFTPLDPSEEGEPVEVRVTRVIQSDIDGKTATARGDGSVDKSMSVGDTFTFCQCSRMEPYPLEVGEKYVANIQMIGICPVHGIAEYAPYVAPRSNQHDTQGNWINKGVFASDIPEYEDEDYPLRKRIDRVTGENFYQPGHMGDIYLKWAQLHTMEDHTFSALGASSMTTLPSYHDNTVTVDEGREITQEEFDTGAAVCMVPSQTARVNQLSVGDKVRMPLMAVDYGNDGGSGYYFYDYSFLNADGEFYPVFWEQEYEIVGTYLGGYGTTDFGDDMFIIPVASVQAGWEDNISGFSPMSPAGASFQLKNGDIDRFDAALKEAVPQAENLTITYDDRGYSEIIRSLRTSRTVAFLLLLAGVLAALAIIALLLYFFVVKEKKRTAVERSLGMTKRQCRVSLLAGLMVLTILAAALGGVCGALALDMVENRPEGETVTAEDMDSAYTYSTEYSLWAEERELAQNTEIEAEAPLAVYFLTPLALCLLVLLLALALITHSFRIDPIYLLSTKEKE